jgi:fatty acid desaturase
MTDADLRADLPAHQQAYTAFNRLLLFAILHVMLTLVCLALAFLGQVPVFALLLGLGGTVALIAGFALSA